MKNLKGKKEGKNAVDDDCYFLGFVVDLIPVFEMQKMLGSKMEMKKYEYCNKEIINHRFDVS